MSQDVDEIASQVAGLRRNTLSDPGSFWSWEILDGFV